MSAVKQVELHENGVGFSFLEKLKRHIDEQYYQLDLLPRLSLLDRQRNFAHYKPESLLKILKFLRAQEEHGDFMEKKVIASLCDRLIDLLGKVEKERSEQTRLGIYHQSPTNYREHLKIWKAELVSELKRMSLPPSIEQRLTIAVLNMNGNSQPVGGFEKQVMTAKPVTTSGEPAGFQSYEFEEHFFEIFAGKIPNQELLLEFLERDGDKVMVFLESKLLEGREQEQLHALEIIRFYPRKRTVTLLSKLSYQEEGEVGERALELLHWIKTQESFSEHIKIIDFYLSKIKKKHQLQKIDEEQLEIENAKKELYLKYFTHLKGAHEEKRVNLIKSLDEKEYRANTNFIEKVFEKEDSVFIRTMILKNISQYRIEELYSLFEKAFQSEHEKVIYHGILNIKEYSLLELLDTLKEHAGHFKKFNAQFAMQVVRLLDE